jgi:hypothetical protein
MTVLNSTRSAILQTITATKVLVGNGQSYGAELKWNLLHSLLFVSGYLYCERYELINICYQFTDNAWSICILRVIAQLIL